MTGTCRPPCTARAHLRGPVRVPGTISSQYLTSLLIIAPLLEAGLTIEVEGELTSKPYVDLTLDEMAKFGVRVDNHDYRRLVVAPQVYRAGSIDVEGDASAASYFAALATLHGASITLSNLGSGTRQGDYAFFGLCEKLGARVTRNAGQHRHRRPAQARRRASTAPVDMTSMPDVAPTLMMIAPFLNRPTRITGSRDVARQGMRPHRRAHARVAQARRDGRRGAGLHGRSSRSTRRERAATAVVEIETYHDHRIAMSFGVLGSRLPGLRILDPGCVAKTYPNYWRDWQRARSVPRAV